MKNIENCFMLIDRNKNILYIPASNSYLGQAINEVGLDRVEKNGTMGELLANVKFFIHGKEER